MREADRICTNKHKRQFCCVYAQITNNVSRSSSITGPSTRALCKLHDIACIASITGGNTRTILLSCSGSFVSYW